ncbi:MAG: hypothetical protein U5K76_15105, partial [Woeseiaceae bacterium]|nr:hypothetical protein [Woeseiaceae bacterium]
MADKGYEVIERQALEQLMKDQQPANDDPKTGYALVNVLGREQFEERVRTDRRPKEEIDEFEKR